MGLIAMATLLISQSADIQTTARFDTFIREQGVNQSFVCVNYVTPDSRRGFAEIRPNREFLCTRKDDGKSWTASQSDIIEGLEDEGYRVCVNAGGIRHPRLRTGSVCIGDL